MARHLTILSGASRGMGLAMARQRLAQGHALVCLSRGHSPGLQAQAEASGTPVWQWTVDLADAAPAAQALQEWLGHEGESPWLSATLVNNAGVIPDIGPLEALAPEAVVRGLRVGLEAAMLLTGAFLRASADWALPRRVLNISSGLGRRPMAAQATYCAAKAGMDHFSRCVALEQAARAAAGQPAARVCALAPGVIDTDMQQQLRQAEASRFPDQPGFASLHAQGQLSSPEAAAARVLAWLDRPDFGQAPVADVRDAA